MMSDLHRLSIPVILGTPRQGRLSEHVAHVMLEQLGRRDDVQTKLIDVRHLDISPMDAGAKAFGLPVVWVNRSGAPTERLGWSPDVIVADLTGLQWE